MLRSLKSDTLTTMKRPVPATIYVSNDERWMRRDRLEVDTQNIALATVRLLGLAAFAATVLDRCLCVAATSYV